MGEETTLISAFASVSAWEFMFSIVGFFTVMIGVFTGVVKWFLASHQSTSTEQMKSFSESTMNAISMVEQGSKNRQTQITQRIDYLQDSFTGKLEAHGQQSKQSIDGLTNQFNSLKEGSGDLLAYVKNVEGKTESNEQNIYHLGQKVAHLEGRVQ